MPLCTLCQWYNISYWLYVDYDDDCQVRLCNMLISQRCRELASVQYYHHMRYSVGHATELVYCSYACMRLLCRHMCILHDHRFVFTFLLTIECSLWLMTWPLDAFTVCKAAKNGKAVLISILVSSSFSYHNFWTKQFHENRCLKIKPVWHWTCWCCFFAALLHVVQE